MIIDHYLRTTPNPLPAAAAFLSFGQIIVSAGSSAKNSIGAPALLAAGTAGGIPVAVIVTLLAVGLIYCWARAEMLQKVAYYDELTGLLGWWRFEYLAQKLFRKNPCGYALVTADIDGFRTLNGIYGKKQGDELLKAIAKSLTKQLERGELVCRIQSDNFAFVLRYRDKDGLAARINDIAVILKGLKCCDFSYNMYFGICTDPEEKDTIIDLRLKAELAMLSIKGSTQVTHGFYCEKLRQRLLAERAIENFALSALSNNEFEVYFQPQYDIVSNKIIGAEALSRWRQQDGGLLMPGSYTRVFERNGFILQLDRYMIRKACELLKSWMEEGLDIVPISVNLSRLHIFNPKFCQSAANIADRYKIPRSMLVFELTEGVFLENTGRLMEFVAELRSNGFCVSIDDFGAGYSTLGLVSQLTADILKIDRNFFGPGEITPRAKVIIREIIHMATQLGMRIIAEGVETRSQAEFLLETGCRMAQGFYFARPMTAQSFKQLLSAKPGTASKLSG